MKNSMKESKSSKMLEVIIEEDYFTNKNRNNKILRSIKSTHDIDFGSKTYQLFKDKPSLFLNNNVNKNEIPSRNLKRRFTDLNNYNRNIILTEQKSENNKLINENKEEINIKPKGRIKREKSHTFIYDKNMINNINENRKMNLKLDFLTNGLNNNLYITSTSISPNHNKKRETIENRKNKINKSKKILEKSGSSLKHIKKIKSLDEIVKEKEIKLENKYKKQKSFRKYISL